MKARIVKITRPDGEIRYQIQQRHFLFRWIWVGVSWKYDYCQDTFHTLEAAQRHLCWYDGTKTKEEVVVYK